MHKKSRFGKILKISCLLFIFLATPLLSTNLVFAATTPDLNVSSDTQTLIAGTSNNITFFLRNLGTIEATEVWVTLSLPSSATGGSLMILEGSDGRWYIDRLSVQEEHSMPLQIYVNPSAAGNLYQLTFAFAYKYAFPAGSSRTETRTIGVNVPILSVTGASISASIKPYHLEAGKNNSLTLRLTNIGDADAQTVVASLNMPGSATGASSLSLINSDGRWIFESIKQGEEISVPILVYASTSTFGQTFQASLSLTYYDYIRARTDTKYLTLSVSSETEPSVNLNIEINPQDLRAGETNNIRLRISNLGHSDATSVQATLTLPAQSATGVPIVLKDSDGKWFFDEIPSGEQAEIQAEVYVTPSSSGTAYQASLSLTYYDDLSRAKQDIFYFGLNVPAVYSPTANIEVGIDDSTLRTGENNSRILTVKNIGDGAAESLSVYLSLPVQQSLSQPLQLIGSDGTWYLGRLEPGEKREIPLEMFAAPSASGIVMSLSVTTSYTDMNYRAKQQVKSIGLISRGSVDLEILSVSTFPQSVTPSKPFSVTVNFINLGTMTAQSVLFKPNGTNQLIPVYSDNIFLGDLAVNAPSSITLTYTGTNLTNGTYNLTLEYSYKDSLGQKFIDHIDVPLRLIVSVGQSNGSDGQSNQGQLFPYFTGIVIISVVVIVAAVAILLVYRSIKRRRSDESIGHDRLGN